MTTQRSLSSTMLLLTEKFSALVVCTLTDDLIGLLQAIDMLTKQMVVCRMPFAASDSIKVWFALHMS